MNRSERRARRRREGRWTVAIVCVLVLLVAGLLFGVSWHLWPYR